MNNHYDIAIIGCGAVGSAALYNASKSGIKVIGFDTLTPPHLFGSSHGESRIVRQAIGENSIYSLLSYRSYKIWEELENITDQKLIYKNGCLMLVPYNEPNIFFENTIKVAKERNIEHIILEYEDIRKRYPEFAELKKVLGYLEPKGGFVNPESIIKTKLRLSKQNGAIFKNAKINSLYEKNDIVHLVTSEGDHITASKVILSSGSWIKDLLPPNLHNLFTIYRQIVYWFDFNDSQHFNYSKVPVFILILHNNKGGIYGIPSINGKKGGIKMATHNWAEKIEQQSINRYVSEEEIQTFYNTYIKDNFGHIINPLCLKTSVCSYTVTPDEGFVVDFFNDSKNILFISACSGHGFKHSAAIGELAIDMLLKRNPVIDPSLLSYKRFNIM